MIGQIVTLQLSVHLRFSYFELEKSSFKTPVPKDVYQVRPMYETCI